MNERIFTELYKKVWGHFPCPTGEPELEKFAELIIKECLDQVRDEVQYLSSWEQADIVTKRVTNHFGVEQ